MERQKWKDKEGSSLELKEQKSIKDKQKIKEITFKMSIQVGSGSLISGVSRTCIVVVMTAPGVTSGQQPATLTGTAQPRALATPVASGYSASI